MWNALFWLLSKLPLRVAQALGAGAGRLSYKLRKRFRSRIDANLQQAGYGALQSAVSANAGRQVFEWPYVWTRSAAQTRALVSTHNWHEFEQAKAHGKGVILLTPHLGCFEICGQYMAAATALTVMYRPHSNPQLNALLERSRTPHYQQLAPANLSGVRMLAKALKRGECVGILPDHVPTQGEGIWADFFGKPAYTSLLPVKLQQMSGAAIVLVYAERLPKAAGYLLHTTLMGTLWEATPEQQARQLNAAMEQLIMKCPDQYFWSYDRWRP